MRRIGNITVGTRSQAVIILTLAVLWYASIVGWLSEWDTRYYFWGNLFALLPFVMLVFGVILFLSYRRSQPVREWLVFIALLAAISPWVLLLAVLIMQM